MLYNKGNHAQLKRVQPQPSRLQGENGGKIYSTWNPGPKIFEVFTADWFFNIACSEFGDIGIIREIMSVYRIHKKGAWSGKPEREQLEEGLTQIDLYNEILSMKYNQEFSALKIKIKNYLEYMVL